MRLLLFVVAALLGVASLSASADDGAFLDAAGTVDFRDTVRRAKARVFPAVVYIRCVSESFDEGKRSAQRSTGSGVIVSAEGLVLTNWHVVEDPRSVRCLLSDGRSFDADVVGADQDTDLALLRLRLGADDAALPVAELGTSGDLSEGDFVMAMGAPFGLNRSVSIGIISCTRRFLPEISEYSVWLQTDAAINPGNSGGPLVNTDGRIVGINARGMGYANGMGFAIPADMVRIVLPRLRDEGAVNWTWIGLQLQPLHDFDQNLRFDETEGVIVAETDPGSPARRAGLLHRDRIIRVNETPVTAMTAEDLPDVRRMLALLPRDTAIRLRVARGAAELDLEVMPREKGTVEGEELELERWNMTVKTINRFENADLAFYRETGVFVFGLDSPGNALAAGLNSQDIITAIDGRPIETLEDIQAAYDAAIADVGDRHRLLLVVLRGGLMRHVVLDFSRDFSRE